MKELKRLSHENEGLGGKKSESKVRTAKVYEIPKRMRTAPARVQNEEGQGREEFKKQNKTTKERINKNLKKDVVKAFQYMEDNEEYC